MQSIKNYGETLIKLSDFVKQLDETVRVEAFKFMLAQEIGQQVVSPAGKAPGPINSAKSREMSPQELIRKSGVDRYSDKAVVLAYWLEEFQKKDCFSSGDLKLAFEQAREKAPQNPSDIVAKLEAGARIMKAGKTGTIQNYRLTGTAIDSVEQWLNRDGGEK
ncbi:MAG TPA: hypothetical protein VGN23_12235 [Verrucomicrobiae bacterium]|jgi:hypothetical protein